MNKFCYIEQKVKVSYKTGMPVAFATKPMYLDWKAVVQEAAMSSYASIANPYLFYDKRNGQCKVRGQRSDGIPLEC